MKYLRFCHIAVTFALIVAVPAIAAGDNGDSEDLDDGGVVEFDDLDQYRVVSDGGLVAADEPQASRIGAQILDDGGNAADAIVAAMLTSGFTNPHSSGLGGGGFCLYRDGDDETVEVIDFRETAPGAAHRDMYVVDGEVDHDLSRRGGLAVATPAEPAGLWALHGRFGQLEWERVVDAPRQLAADGFTVGTSLADRLRARAEAIEDAPQLAALFRDDDGEWLEAGDEMTRPRLADTLEILRDEGVHPFYTGDIARAIVAATDDDGGILSTDDLASYGVERREPIVGDIAGHQIYSMPPPSSGGIALIQAFNILEELEIDPEHTAFDDPQTVHYVVEALKHAFADRARWLGDTDFVDVPIDRLTSSEYAADLAEQIESDTTLESNAYGSIPPHWEGAGTAHMSAVDADDNAVACTTTINTSFGSMVLVDDYGLILNNEMADFTVEPGEPNVYGLIGTEQNAVEANKRPLSSMSPTLMTTDGAPSMTLGASGGPMIITGVFLTILHTRLFDATPMEAMTAPRLHHQWIPDELRLEVDGLPVADGLRERGHNVDVARIFSAVQLIMRDDERWIGVTDPRKGGIPAASEISTDDD